MTNDIRVVNTIPLRDYFAAKALSAVTSEIQETVPDGFINWVKHLLLGYGLSFLEVKYRNIEGIQETIAQRAYELADAMIKESNKNKYI